VQHCCNPENYLHSSQSAKLEQALLDEFRDLEAVWSPGGASMQPSLLALSLDAMRALLASDVQVEQAQGETIF
jgi:hypothetical protein